MDYKLNLKLTLVHKLILYERKITKRLPRPVLSKSGVTLSAYNNTTVPVHGKCVCYVTDGKSKMPIFFIVTDNNLPPVLGLPTSQKLSLIQRVIGNIEITNRIELSYPECFGEIGCLSYTYHIELNP